MGRYTLSGTMPTLQHRQDYNVSSGIGPVAGALIGAGGALLGGGLASGTQVLLEWRRAKRQTKAEQRLRHVEWRQAARLILEELRVADLLLRQAVAARRYWEPPRQLSTANWTRYSPHLAAYVTDRPSDHVFWSRVADAFNELDRLNWLANDRWRTAERVAAANRAVFSRQLRPPRARVWPADRTRQSWRAIRAGMHELEQSVGLESEESDAESGIENELWPYGDADEFNGDPDADWFDPGEEW
jgi:hypothetical protein